MDQPTKRRFRFGLRTLLLLVAALAGIVAAYSYYQQPPYEVRQAVIGMTEARARTVFGKPTRVHVGGVGPWRLLYRYDWGELDLTISDDTGRVDRIMFLYLDGDWHEKAENGNITHLE